MRGSTVRTEDQLIPREDSTFPLLPTPRDSCVLPLSPLTYRGVLRPLATCIYIYMYIFNEPSILIPRYSTRHLDEIYRRPDCGKQTTRRLESDPDSTDGDSSLGRNILKFGIK